MSTPQTLLEMVGAPLAPAGLSAATLLMIDCQREYVDGGLVLPGVGAALEEGARLLERARAAGTPIVHVAHHSPAGAALFDPDGPYSEIAPEVAPRPDEARVIKGLPNAFAGTDLLDVLTDLGRKELIVAGFMSHMCVSSTVRAALDLGFRATVVDTAVATRDLPDGHGGIVSAADMHRAAMAALSDRFAIIAADSAALPE